MKPITFPLRAGDQGAEVANLQTGLILLLTHQLIQVDPAQRSQLLNALDTELQGQTFKDATKETVGRFQEQRHIARTGVVDEATAQALNAMLRDMGALNGDDSVNVRRTVAGQVIQGDQVPFVGSVILFHEDPSGSIRVGEDTTDPEGRYTITYDPISNGGIIKLRVAAFDADGQRRAEKAFEDTSTVELVNLQVQGEGRTFLIKGTVSSRTRAGIGQLRVVIVDKQVGGDTTIRETATAADGSYQTSFTYSGQKQSPDLQARVFRGDKLLGFSEVRYNTSNVETLDVMLAEAADAALDSEHETLTKELAVHFGGSIRDLKETEDQQDITFLANKTGWDARAVAMASLADQFSARTVDAQGNAIHPSLFYALFRAGLPANDAALYRTDSAHVEAVWKQALEQGVVPASVAAGIPAALAQYETVAAKLALQGSAIAGLSSLGELLKVSMPNATVEDQEQFAKLRIQHQGQPPAFWDAVKATFGDVAQKRLRLDGQLSHLTMNNAPLVAKLHAAAGDVPISDPLNLVERGYHRAEKWRELIGNDSIPPEIFGATDPEKRANYADVMAMQLRLSYPTATVAAMVKSGETPVTAGAPAGTPDKVHAFLMQNQDRFAIGMQPIEQFLHRQQIDIEPDVSREITRIQRVRQITPSDDSMNALLKRGLDSASAVVRYDRDEFISALGEDLGGEQQANLVHAKAQQVHNVVLNIATSYLLAANAPGIGVHSPARIIDPVPSVPENTGDVIAYASLEKLLGGMDYCECQECRSILSPAAYLVDLLNFVDRDETRWKDFCFVWKKDHETAPYPFLTLKEFKDAGEPPDTEIVPLQVLLSRRPDLQHLPLTCENTNVALPYVDLVNETLEYFVAHALNLTGFTGHNTDNQVTSEELMANPQFVEETAYDILSGETIAGLMAPTPLLPFHQPLENLRRLFALFDGPLPHVMEAVRQGDVLERAAADTYGWRDIWMEELRLSRAEHALLTDSTLPLQKIYGFKLATPDAELLAALSNAAAFARRLNISYQDLIDLLRTRFINPNGTLIPKAERLGVPLSTLKAFKDGVMTDAELQAAVAPQLDEKQYGGDIKAWVKNQANYDRLMSLLLLADPTGVANVGSFDSLEFRYADPAKLAQRVRPFEFVRLLRFIRLWKKLGWTIEQTDKTITALSPAGVALNDADDTVNLKRLDEIFLTLLPRIGIVKRVMDSLNLKVKKDLLPLLACFAPMDTYGSVSLYRRLFPTSLLQQDPVFSDDGFGNFLSGSENLLEHQEVLRSALTLTDDEFKKISEALEFKAATTLTVDNVSAVFRRGWLARQLKLSVQELLPLMKHSGIDPFAAINPVGPQTLAFIELVNQLRATDLKPSQALYLFWNEDLTGKSAPDPAQLNQFARCLRSGLAAVESEFNIVDDLDGQIARARMALVYDNETTDFFFGLLNNTLVVSVPHSHSQPTLEQNILDAAPGQIAYDDFRKQLSFSGVMSETVRDALKAGAPVSFALDVGKLYTENQKAVGDFFKRYPELQKYYDAYAASNETLEKKRSLLLENFLPELRRRRKRQQALQAISAEAGTDAAFAQAVLDDAATLHATGDAKTPALDDLTGIEKPGLAGPSGSIEAPQSGFYNIRIEADAGADITLAIDGKNIELMTDGSMWSNKTPIELRAGALQSFSLKAEKVKNPVRVYWQTTGRGWEIIPDRYLYSGTILDHLYEAYVRFFKAASLAKALKLTANEIAFLASRAEYQIGGESWLNSIPVTGTPDIPASVALFKPLTALVEFASLKAEFSPDDERLMEVFRNPAAATDKIDSLLFVLTAWRKVSLQALLTHFGKSGADLASIECFQRVATAYEWVQKLAISPEALMKAATNEPTATIVRDLQAALRARYAESDWLNLIKPVNDELRGLQRDALVAYILHQMQADPSSAHIDTPDKLFEYFLMDVQMEPCMQTSRIRHALSSVQLFIDRCLMNLEPRVASSVLNRKLWDWMRRYRLWEANRITYLRPENLLEPELRDDQSIPFKEMMSELLQGDITEDRAAIALGNYLSKLDEVAKLEPLGIHFLENDPGTADDIAHVVARTAGSNRKHYYRRREYGYWTPWEEVKLDIGDSPVIPVVWKSRLFLFWPKILKITPQNASDPIQKDKDLTKVRTSDVKTDPPKVIVQAMLCWSEYYNGKWQPPRTSAAEKPTVFGEYESHGKNEFAVSDVSLEAIEEGAGLRFIIQESRGSSSFLLYNTHSVPVRQEDAAINGAKQPHSPDDRRRRIYAEATGLSVGYASKAAELSRHVLSFATSEISNVRSVDPRHFQVNPWSSPFFLSDSRHVFYVTTTEKLVTVSEHQGYGGGAGAAPPKGSFKIPPIVLIPKRLIPDRIGPIIDEPLVGIVDRLPIERFVTEDAYIKKGLGTIGTVRMGSIELGPAGAITKQR